MNLIETSQHIFTKTNYFHLGELDGILHRHLIFYGQSQGPDVVPVG